MGLNSEVANALYEECLKEVFFVTRFERSTLLVDVSSSRFGCLTVLRAESVYRIIQNKLNVGLSLTTHPYTIDLVVGVDSPGKIEWKSEVQKKRAEQSKKNPYKTISIEDFLRAITTVLTRMEKKVKSRTIIVVARSEIENFALQCVQEECESNNIRLTVLRGCDEMDYVISMWLWMNRERVSNESENDHALIIDSGDSDALVPFLCWGAANRTFLVDTRKNSYNIPSDEQSYVKGPQFGKRKRKVETPFRLYTIKEHDTLSQRGLLNPLSRFACLALCVANDWNYSKISGFGFKSFEVIATSQCMKSIDTITKASMPYNCHVESCECCPSPYCMLKSNLSISYDDVETLLLQLGIEYLKMNTVRSCCYYMGARYKEKPEICAYKPTVIACDDDDGNVDDNVLVDTVNNLERETTGKRKRRQRTSTYKRIVPVKTNDDSSSDDAELQIALPFIGNTTALTNADEKIPGNEDKLEAEPTPKNMKRHHCNLTKQTFIDDEAELSEEEEEYDDNGSEPSPGSDTETTTDSFVVSDTEIDTDPVHDSPDVLYHSRSFVTHIT